VARTVPSIRHLNNILRSLDPCLLADLLEQSVQALQEEIPGLGEVVAYDVKHIYANVKENNWRAYVKERFNKDQQPKGDPDCRLGVKKSTNQEQADGSTKEKKELLWGYGSGVAAAITPDYGDVVLAEFTQPFNENDITYFISLYIQSVATLNCFPLHITADAAFDAWYAYQTCAFRDGIAAIPLNQHAHPVFVRDADGTPRCPMGLRMSPTYQFQHTNGYRAQRYRCPLLFPQATGQSCDHEQFRKGKGCVKDINIEAGGLMRVTLDRTGPLYKAIYKQRTSCERINSQAKDLGIERPKARNIRSVRRLNTLIYITINIKALQRAREINASLLTPKLGKLS
jgi:Transposase DDE domain